MPWITGADILALPTPPDVTLAQAQDAADAAEALVITWCNRAIEPTMFREWLVAVTASSVLVSNPPIRRVYRTCTDTQYGLSLTNATADANSITASIQDGAMHLSVMGGASAGDVALTLSAYTTMALLLAAIVAAPQNWAGAVVNEGDPQDLKPGFLGNVLDATTLYTLLPDADVPADLLDRDSGLLYLDGGWASGAGENFVRYDGGLAAVPDDLTRITLALAVDLIREMARDSALQSEKLDKYAWTRVAGDAGLTARYKKQLAPWRRQTIV